MRLSLIATFAALIFTNRTSAQSTPLKTEMVATGYSLPIFVTAPPGDCDRLFVVEQGGAIQVLKHGVKLPVPFLDVTTLLDVMGGERGLLGLAFHPSYATNGFFFVNYTRKVDGATVVARYKVSNNPDVADPASALIEIVIAQPFENHNGGMLAFGPNDGFLYIGMGDGGSGGDPFNNAQNIDVLLGKMLRIDVDHPGATLPYSIPPTNPFAGPTPGADEIWGIGLRNPWRFSFDRANGDLYIGDVGQETREEIDYQPASSQGRINYGWRCMEGLTCTGLNGPPGCACGDSGLELPVHDYPHADGCAVVGGYVYRGFAAPSLAGTYFFADHCSKRFWSFEINGSTKTNFLERTAELAPPFGVNNPTSFGEDANGELYITYLSGEVMKIVPAAQTFAGVASYGSGTPGCTGAETLAATCVPRIGNPCLQLRCTRTPPASVGLGLITDAQSGGMDPFGFGVKFLLDIPASTMIFSFDFHSNASGIAVGSLGIPNHPTLIGATVFAQGLFSWGVNCPLPPFGLSSSNGISITLQP